jgi:hypothetical protein
LYEKLTSKSGTRQLPKKIIDIEINTREFRSKRFADLDFNKREEIKKLNSLLHIYPRLTPKNTL